MKHWKPKNKWVIRHTTALSHRSVGPVGSKENQFPTDISRWSWAQTALADRKKAEKQSPAGGGAVSERAASARSQRIAEPVRAPRLV